MHFTTAHLPKTYICTQVNMSSYTKEEYFYVFKHCETTCFKNPTMDYQTCDYRDTVHRKTYPGVTSFRQCKEQ